MLDSILFLYSISKGQEEGGRKLCVQCAMWLFLEGFVSLAKNGNCLEKLPSCTNRRYTSYFLEIISMFSLTSFEFLLVLCPSLIILFAFEETQRKLLKGHHEIFIQKFRLTSCRCQDKVLLKLLIPNLI